MQFFTVVMMYCVRLQYVRLIFTSEELTQLVLQIFACTITYSWRTLSCSDLNHQTQMVPFPATATETAEMCCSSHLILSRICVWLFLVDTCRAFCSHLQNPVLVQSLLWQYTSDVETAGRSSPNKLWVKASLSGPVSTFFPSRKELAGCWGALGWPR